MDIKPLKPRLKELIVEHQLGKKWAKAKNFFESDIRHPSLNVELLEPRWRGIYSFRLDKKYRALFFITPNNEAEILQITKHYKKN